MEDSWEYTFTKFIYLCSVKHFDWIFVDNAWTSNQHTIILSQYWKCWNKPTVTYISLFNFIWARLTFSKSSLRFLATSSWILLNKLFRSLPRHIFQLNREVTIFALVINTKITIFIIFSGTKIWILKQTTLSKLILLLETES